MSLMDFPMFLSLASMHYWKGSSGMHLSSIVMVLLITSMPSKQFPLTISLNLEKKKSSRARSSELGGYFSTVMFLSAVMKQPWFVLPKLLSLLVHWAKHMPQDRPPPPGRLTDWSFSLMARILWGQCPSLWRM